MVKPTIHLRSECKPLEYRSARTFYTFFVCSGWTADRVSVTPSTAKALIGNGYTVDVERSPARIFKDEEFQAIGATLVPEGSWPTVPHSHLIMGLKELPEDDTPLPHTHIQFAQ